jgi:HK97 gp10 family phage protein
MAAPFTIQLDGLERTISKLKKMDNEVADRVDEVLENAVTIIAGNARQLAPVDTGRLRGSIQPGAVAKLTWEVVASARYAPYIEFGTGGLVDIPAGLEKYASQFKGNDKRKVNIRPQPFLYPAFMAYRKQLVIDLKRELEKPR